jgi:peroxiredoxin Q/BCP
MKAQLFLVVSLVAGLWITGESAQESPARPKAGDKAPRVAGKNEKGQPWKLEETLRQKAVLLYFYPKDDTPGCTKEACGFRDSLGDLQKNGVEVVGVSFDNEESHRKFIEKHSLNFSLLADIDGKIADAFGVRVPGKNVARRVSFLIGKDGKIVHVTDSPQAEVHLSEMKEAVGKLKKE